MFMHDMYEYSVMWCGDVVKQERQGGMGIADESVGTRLIRTGCLATIETSTRRLPKTAGKCCANNSILLSSTI